MPQTNKEQRKAYNREYYLRRKAVQQLPPPPPPQKTAIKKLLLINDNTPMLLHMKKNKPVLRNLMTRVWFLSWLKQFDEVMEEFNEKVPDYICHRENKGIINTITALCDKCKMPFQPVNNDETHDLCYLCFTNRIKRGVCLIKLK